MKCIFGTLSGVTGEQRDRMLIKFEV